MSSKSQSGAQHRENAEGGTLLIVEDELFLGLDIGDWVADMGYSVLGPVMELRSARRIMQLHDVDVAIIDLFVEGGDTCELARELCNQQVPFLIYTGNPDLAHKLGLAELAPILAKPISPDEMRGHVRQLLTGDISSGDVAP